MLAIFAPKRKPHQFRRAARRRGARAARRVRALRLTARAVKGMIHPVVRPEAVTGLETPPAWLPRFESDWTPQGFAIPDYFTDNTWRAEQTAVRAAWGLPPFEDYPTTADIQIFCSPYEDQTLPEDPAADGSEANPWRLVASALAAAIAAGPGTLGNEIVIGFETGLVIEDTSSSLTATSAFLDINNAALLYTKYVCWFRVPGERRPCVVRRMKAYGTDPSQWDRVDMKAASPAGTVVSTGGVYSASATSEDWHLNTVPTGIASGSGIWGAAFGTRDSILEVVDITDSASFKAHGWDRPHVFRNAQEDAGGGTTVIPSSNFAPLDQERQWCVTGNGGVIVHSSVNPATLGGIYLINRFHTGVTITVGNVFWGNALQFEYCGAGIRINVNAGGSMDGVVLEGVYARCCTAPYYVASATNGSPVTGAFNGSLHMGCPGNESYVDPTQGALGDGTMPWISDLRIEHVRAFACFAGIEHYGWCRGMRIYDLRVHALRLECGNCIYFAANYAFDYDDHNDLMYFYASFVDCGTGIYADSDGGVDHDNNCGNLRVHHGRILTSIRGGQINGGARGAMFYCVELLDVVHGFEFADTCEDGCAEGSIEHCRVVLSRRSDWHTVARFPSSLGRNFGLKVDRRANMQPRGPINDAETRFHNTHFRGFNNEIDLGTADADEADAVFNDTIIAEAPAPAIVGAWQDTTPGGPNHRARNGLDVSAGQTQVSQLFACPLDGLRLVGFAEERRFVDGDLNPCALQEAAVTNLQVADTADRAEDGTLTSAAPEAARSGNTLRLAVAEGPDLAWLQPGTSLRDLRLIGPNDSIGPLAFT